MLFTQKTKIFFLILIMFYKKFLLKVYRKMNKYTEAAQLKDPHYIDKVNEFRNQSYQNGAVVFLGDSITEQGDWSNVKLPVPVYNFGISGDTSYGVLMRIDQVINIQPSAVVLTIGVNDLQRGFTPERVSENTFETVNKLIDAGVKKVFIQTVLPVIESKLQSGITNSTIRQLNSLNAKILFKLHSGFLYCTEVFEDDERSLRAEFTDDGLHLNKAGYDAWYEFLDNFLPRF